MSKFDEMGGHATFEKLVSHFYALVAIDPILRPMYPDEDFKGAAERLLMFLEQYWGGPTTYGEKRGHPRLRMRHALFSIGEVERDEVQAGRALVDEALVSYAVKTYGAKKPGMILVNNAWGESNQKGLKDALQAANLPAAGIEKYEANDVDMVPQLSRLKEAGADALFLVGNVGPSAQVVKSLDRMGWSVPVVPH